MRTVSEKAKMFVEVEKTNESLNLSTTISRIFLTNLWLVEVKLDGAVITSASDTKVHAARLSAYERAYDILVAKGYITVK